MTFNTTVPNANQSPGEFPAQNNTNFQRLKDIIDNDHNFSDSFSTSQGFHKQVHLINRSVPIGLDSASGILYTFNTGVASELFYYNGANNYQISPTIIRVVGSANVASATNLIVYPDPSFSWVGTGHALISATNTFIYSNLVRSGANYNNVLQQNPSSGLIPFLFFVGNDLVIRNPSGVSQNLAWSVILNRVS